MMLLPLMQYNMYVVQPHLFEKLVGYFSNNVFSSLPNFKQLVLNYRSTSIRNLTKFNLFRFFLHFFLLERISFSKSKFIFVKNSISDFKIAHGQVSGFSAIMRDAFMYNFIYQYMYNNIHLEKNFLGLSIDRRIYSTNFGSISMLIQDFFTLPMVVDFVDVFEELFPEYESSIGVNISLSTYNILCIFLYFSHLQFPLNDLIYYQYY